MLEPLAILTVATVIIIIEIVVIAIIAVVIIAIAVAVAITMIIAVFETIIMYTKIRFIARAVEYSDIGRMLKNSLDLYYFHRNKYHLSNSNSNRISLMLLLSLNTASLLV